MGVRSDYLHSVMDMTKFPSTVKAMAKLLRKHKDKFDTIVFCGMSGALIAPALAQVLKKQILMVRKEDKSHSCFKIEGHVQCKNYIVIDDLISSGSTMEYIAQKIKSDFRDYGVPKCVAVALYHANPEFIGPRCSRTVAVQRAFENPDAFIIPYRDPNW